MSVVMYVSGLCIRTDCTLDTATLEWKSASRRMHHLAVREFINERPGAEITWCKLHHRTVVQYDFGTWDVGVMRFYIAKSRERCGRPTIIIVNGARSLHTHMQAYDDAVCHWHSQHSYTLTLHTPTVNCLWTANQPTHLARPAARMSMFGIQSGRRIYYSSSITLQA